MADIVPAEVRSRMMCGIRSGNTRPELRLRSMLHAKGYRYRVHAGNRPGRPDIVMRRYKAAIFVHGCFWHRHSGCHWCTTPASNTAFWDEKLSANVRRDAVNTDNLVASGW